MALWRWISLLDGSETTEEYDRVQEAFSTLYQSRFAERMSRFPILSSLPKLREDINRRLSGMVWRREIGTHATAELASTLSALLRIDRDLAWSGVHLGEALPVLAVDFQRAHEVIEIRGLP